jgi:hypothetical protein
MTARKTGNKTGNSKKPIKATPRKKPEVPSVAKRLTRIFPQMCDDAVEWMGEETNANKLWKECVNGYWMSWILRRSTVAKPALRAAVNAARKAIGNDPHDNQTNRQALVLETRGADQRAAAAKVLRKFFPKAPEIKV